MIELDNKERFDTKTGENFCRQKENSPNSNNITINTPIISICMYTHSLFEKRERDNFISFPSSSYFLLSFKSLVGKKRTSNSSCKLRNMFSAEYRGIELRHESLFQPTLVSIQSSIKREREERNKA